MHIVDDTKGKLLPNAAPVSDLLNPPASDFFFFWWLFLKPEDVF